MRRLWRIGKIFFLLLLLSAGGVWYLLGTEHGYRRLPTLINRLTPYTLSYDALDGKFLGRQTWRNFHLQGGGLDFRSGRLVLDLSAKALWRRNIHIRELSIADTELHLPPSVPRVREDSQEALRSLPEVKLPLSVHLDELSVAALRIYREDKSLLDISRARGALHGEGQAVRLELATALMQGEGEQALQIDAALRGEATLTKDYPLSLTLDGTLNADMLPSQQLALQIDGSALKPHLTLRGEGAVQALAEGRAEIDLAAQRLEAGLSWSEVDYDDGKVRAQAGAATLQGAFSQLSAKVQGDLSGKDFPPLTLDGAAVIAPDAVRDLALTVETLGGTLRADGFFSYGEALVWEGRIQAENLDGRRYAPEWDARLQADIHSRGKKENGRWQAALAIDELNGSWQGHPLRGGGEITLDGEQLQVRDLHLDLAGNTLAADGTADGSALDLSAALQAAAPERLLPALQGALQAEVKLSGTVQRPQILADGQWKNLRYLADGEALFASSDGSLHAEGTLQQLAVQLQGAAVGRDFPALKLRGSAQISPQAAEEIALVVNTMDGEIHLDGRSDFAPRPAWEAQLRLQNIRPRHYLPQIAAQLSGEVRTQGRVEEGGVVLSALLENLRGTWQGQTLQGGADFSLNGGDLRLQELQLAVGGNRLKGALALQQGKLEGDLQLDAPELARLYPEADGSVQGRIQLGGTAAAPTVKSVLQASGLRYGEQRIGSAEITLDSGLTAGAGFNNRISLHEVGISGEQWQQMTVETQGRFNAHRLTLNTVGGQYNAELSAQGGFSAPDSWAGTIEALTAEVQDLRWRLRRSSRAAFSPKNISLEDFCLADEFSAFCLTLQSGAQTLLDYAIERIDPRSLKSFLPEALTLDTQLQGAGKITVAEGGRVRGEADLTLTPGKITARIPGQPPLLLNLQNAALNARFNEQTAHSRLNVVFADAGEIDAELGMRGLGSRGQLDGALKLSLPDIGKFAYFVPQVSGLKGRIGGDFQIGGTVSESLLSGDLQLEDGALNIPEYATELKNIRIRLSAARDGNINIDGGLSTPKGGLETKGVLRLQPLLLTLNISGKEMLLADAKTMRLVATPVFDIRIDPQAGIVVKGDVLIPEAAVSIPDTRSAVAVSKDVVIVNNAREADPEPYTPPASSPLQADIAVRLGDKVFFRDPNMNIRLSGGLTVAVRPGRPVSGRGRIEVASGIYELYGQELDIRRGWVTFSGDITNPALDVLALREVDNVDAGAHLSGTVRNMRLDLTSEPAMPDSAILSYLIFGRAPDSATDSTALLQTAAAVGTKGLFPDNLANVTGLDVFDLGVSGLKAGKFLTEDIYVGMKSNFFTSVSEALARYKITDRLSVETSISTKDGSALDFLYEFETD